MADSLTNEQKVAEAERYKALFASEEAGSCFADLEGQLAREWISCSEADQAQEKWLLVKALRRLRTVIQAKIDAGKMAAVEIQRASTPKSASGRPVRKTADSRPVRKGS